MPHNITYFRHGEVCLLLKPKDPNAAAAHGRFDAGYLYALDQALAGVGRHDNPFQGPIGPRTPIPMQRWGDRGLQILQTVNLASWIPVPEQLDARNPEHLPRLQASIAGVPAALATINQRAGEDLGEYILVGASPNWLETPFGDGG